MKSKRKSEQEQEPCVADDISSTWVSHPGEGLHF